MNQGQTPSTGVRLTRLPSSNPPVPCHLTGSRIGLRPAGGLCRGIKDCDRSLPTSIGGPVLGMARHPDRELTYRDQSSCRWDTVFSSAVTNSSSAALPLSVTLRARPMASLICPGWVTRSDHPPKAFAMSA